MKRHFFFLVFALLSGRGFSQSPEPSAAAKQVDSLLKVSSGLTAQRDFKKALEVNVAAEKVALSQEPGMGRESVAYGDCVHNRGKLLYFMGDFIESERSMLEAIAIRQKVLGNDHPDVASSMNNLANLYNIVGNYEKAEPLLLKSQSIWAKVPGKGHPLYAKSLNNLASLYMVMGDYEKAEPLYVEAETIHEKIHGKSHPDYCASLNNLAVLYQTMGNYEKAELLHFEAKTIRENVVGKEHPDYATSLNNLANLLNRTGKHEKAEQFHLEAIAIREKTLGKEHQDYSESLLNLAIHYSLKGDYEKAGSLFLETKAIVERTLGKDHPEYAQCLENLAIHYSKTGQFVKAEPLHLEAMAIRENVVGKEHPDFASGLNNFTAHFLDLGNFEKAGALSIELSRLNQRLLEKAVRHLSERELGIYLNKFSESQAQALQIVQMSGSEKVAQTCFDNALFYKGFLLQAVGQLKRQAISDPATAEKLNLLKSFSRRLAALYAQPLSRREGTKVAQLESQANELEKDLARTVAVFGQALRQVTWQEVQAALKPNEAAVEFVNYHFSEKISPTRERYAALLLRHGQNAPQFIYLFDEKQLDSLLNTTGERKADYANHLYSLAGRGAVARTKPQKSLFEIVWQPLEIELIGIETVFFSPSGLLHRLSLSAIPISTDSTLADKYHLVELGSTRQIVIPQLVETKNQTAALFGGIQYEMDSTAIAAANLGFEKLELVSRGGLNFTQTDPTLRGGNWDYLPGTEKEISALEKTMKAANLKTETRRAWAATEEAFKHLGSPSPRILHLATHGFFFPNPTGSRVSSHSEGADPVFKMSDNPLIRAGLIMAGGNCAWQTGKSLKPSMDDGILTAFEISQMDLSNTELVVLSACETGLGDIQGNEGVYGLQRAFKIAGAKYLIMSLWQVPDRQTSLLMITFYKKWLSDKMDIPVAFRAAQKELREAGLDPYQWAGFVLVE